MNRFTIKDIENLSGIKAHTWRIWELRYGIAIPQRKDSNHRFYDNENLKRILRISYLYHGGLKISKIASLNDEQMRSRAIQSAAFNNDYEYYIKELVEASIDLDEDRFEQIFDDAIKRMGIEQTVLQVCYPFQDKIGFLWLTDHVIPSQEHFTSNIIRQKLSVAIDELPLIKETSKKQILLFTPEKEFHELPLQFIYYLLRKNRNKVIYFGGNASLDSIESYGQKKRVDCMLFHLVTNLTSRSANEYVEEVSRRFADKQIIMSGVLVEQVTQARGNVRLLKSMAEIIQFTNE